MSKAIRETDGRRKASRTGNVRSALKRSKMRGRVPVAIIAASLFGCSGETRQSDDVAASPAETAAPDWKSLPDGSRGYFVQRDDGSQDAERCWQVEGRWDCLGAFTLGQSKPSDGDTHMAIETDMAGPKFIAARAFKKRLNDPFPHGDEDDPKGGYGCTTTGGGLLNETIFAGSTDKRAWLLSNDSAPGQPYGGSPWSAPFVNKFMRENGVAADRPYWNCWHVERLIALGSLATLVTTALTYDAMIGPESAEAP